MNRQSSLRGCIIGTCMVEYITNDRVLGPHFGKHIITFSLPGASTDDVIAFISSVELSLLDFIVIEVGINDIEENWMSSLCDVIDFLTNKKDRYPQLHVILAEVIPSTKGRLKSGIKKWNRWLRKLIPHSIHLLKTEVGFVGHHLKRKLANDGLHLSKYGCQVFSRIIRYELNRIFGSGLAPMHTFDDSWSRCRARQQCPLCHCLGHLPYSCQYVLSE